MQKPIKMIVGIVLQLLIIGIGFFVFLSSLSSGFHWAVAFIFSLLVCAGVALGYRLLAKKFGLWEWAWIDWLPTLYWWI